ncbi:acyl-[acyl-carrier-protein] thioesterase [Deferribacter abyssi]|uniref:acyl-[acyl-carrier-protein] thioesterase n=1 Tax=Deferribacter abyssi TaxID=213806 RepID=UPI003C1B5F46
MKFKVNAIINSYDIDFKGELTLNAIAKYFQIAAITHSNYAGYTNGFFTESGFAWILNRLHIKILEYPVYMDKINVITWSKGSKGFFAFRDFILEKSGEKCVVGSSVWLLIDVTNKRPVKVKKEIVEKYTVENKNAFNSNIRQYKPDKIEKADNVFEYQLRYKDYDINGHVNNSVYFELIEDAIYKEYNKKVSEIKICYFKEINQQLRDVYVLLTKKDDSLIYSICLEDTVFASGEAIVS